MVQAALQSAPTLHACARLWVRSATARAAAKTNLTVAATAAATTTIAAVVATLALVRVCSSKRSKKHVSKQRIGSMTSTGDLTRCSKSLVDAAATAFQQEHWLTLTSLHSTYMTATRKLHVWKTAAGEQQPLTVSVPDKVQQAHNIQQAST